MIDALSYQALVRQGTARLAGAGIEDARFEARLLMLTITGMDSTRWISAEMDPAPLEVADRFAAMIEARTSRRPLQHILGTTEFFGLEFQSDGRALIPRADSEVVVEAALRLLGSKPPVFVVDLGTGSGCLLGAILANRTDARGLGVDISPDACALARENLARLGLADRASLFEGSWADWTGWAEADLIVSNPPYIASPEIALLAPEVRDHDPHLALDGGPDGLVAYREIVGLAAPNMRPGAWLVFEVGHDQKDAVSGLLEAADFTDIGAAKDLAGHDRAVWARKRES